MTRTAGCLAKLDRMNQTLSHQEADRVPVSDFFWGSFIDRWRQEGGLASDADIYRYYDLDWRVTRSNRDPHIQPFEVLRETDEEIVVRTGYGAVVRKIFRYPMPEFLSFATDTIEKMLAFEFDDPWDPRRYFSPGDNQTGGIGDGFERNSRLGLRR
jgi:uroporphyrinogen decarboxylase